MDTAIINGMSISYITCISPVTEPQGIILEVQCISIGIVFNNKILLGLSKRAG